MNRSQIRFPKQQNSQMHVQVNIQHYSGKHHKEVFELNKNIYEQVKKHVQGDFVVVIGDQICSTVQSLVDFNAQNEIREFILNVYTFQNLLDLIKELKQQIEQLTEDDKSKSKVILRRQKMNSTLLATVKQTQLSFQQSQILESRQTSNISKMVQINQMCHFCQTAIEVDAVQTICAHFYHDHCLNEFIQSQIACKQPVIKCICNVNQKIQLLNSLENEFAVQAYKQQLFLNQLDIIKQRYTERIIKCKNRFCQFFYIIDRSQEVKNYCPLCLQ